MKITVINGNMRHGSTWNSKEILLKEIAKHTQIQVTEFYMPKDMPHFCNGCFSCFSNGEQTCPHSEYVSPILTALAEADVIILASPVYGLDVTGQMKVFCDHMCFMWLIHRPNPAMFNKLGVTVSTTAGAGLGHATKTLTNSLKFWGVKRIYRMKNTVMAMSWDEVPEKNRKKIYSNAAVLAKRIATVAQKVDKISNPIFRSFFFALIKTMMKKNTWALKDREHWERLGWLNGVKPF